MGFTIIDNSIEREKLYELSMIEFGLHYNKIEIISISEQFQSQLYQ